MSVSAESVGEAFVVQQVAQISGRPDVSVDASPLDLGIGSIGLLRLASALQERFGVPVDFAELFAAESLRELARILTVQAGDTTACDFRGDVELDVDIRFARAGAAAAAPGQVLLTGATGFVGRQLLSRMLAHGDATIHCLVRAEDAHAARERLPSRSERVVAVAGDLGHPSFGLPESAFQVLAEQVDTIVHCGADVNHLMGYRNLRAVNVLATKVLLRLAAVNTNAFHLISTISASGTGGYGLSKRAAEKLAEQAAGRGLRTAIYRLGRVSGATDTGQWQDRDLYAMLIKGSVAAARFPDFGADWDEVWTPVDEVADRLAAAISMPRVTGVLQFTGGEIRYADVVKWTRSYGCDFEVVPAEQWATRIAEDPENPAYPVAARMRLTEDEDELPAMTFDQPAGIEMDTLSSTVSERIFHKYLDQLL
jgi:nonribosomal peptide synthetase MxcG